MGWIGINPSEIPLTGVKSCSISPIPAEKNACIRTGSYAGSVPFNTYAGSVPFNTNAGSVPFNTVPFNTINKGLSPFNNGAPVHKDGRGLIRVVDFRKSITT